MIVRATASFCTPSQQTVAARDIESALLWAVRPTSALPETSAKRKSKNSHEKVYNWHKNDYRKRSAKNTKMTRRRENAERRTQLSETFMEHVPNMEREWFVLLNTLFILFLFYVGRSELFREFSIFDFLSDSLSDFKNSLFRIFLGIPSVNISKKFDFRFFLGFLQ